MRRTSHQKPMRVVTIACFLVTSFASAPVVARTFANAATQGNASVAQQPQEGKITQVSLATSTVAINGQTYRYDAQLLQNEKTGATRYDRLMPGAKVLFTRSEQPIDGYFKLKSLEFLNSSP